MMVAMTRVWLTALAIASLLGPLTGCRPKVGASCKAEGKEVCATDKGALVCHDGTWVEMTCRGPAGCAKSGEGGVCDQSVAEEKDTCAIEHDFVCTSDKQAMLECQKGASGLRWTLSQRCQGERGCVLDNKKVACDDSIANVGDACREEDDYACAADKKSALACKNKSFALASSCRGKNGCRLMGDKATGFKVDCDDTVAVAGDPCDKENNYACAPDEKTILKCVGKKFAVEDKCRAKEKCAIRSDMVSCN